MSGLGLPILGDEFFPVLTGKALGDFGPPMQLLAKTLEFTDPVTGKRHRFESPAELQAWTSFPDWGSRRAGPVEARVAGVRDGENDRATHGPRVTALSEDLLTCTAPRRFTVANIPNAVRYIEQRGDGRVGPVGLDSR